MRLGRRRLPTPYNNNNTASVARESERETGRRGTGVRSLLIDSQPRSTVPAHTRTTVAVTCVLITVTRDDEPGGEERTEIIIIIIREKIDYLRQKVLRRRRVAGCRMAVGGVQIKTDRARNRYPPTSPPTPDARVLLS